MSEHSVSFNETSLSAYPKTVSETVAYLKENGSVDKTEESDFYVHSQTLPQFEDSSKIWVHVTAPQESQPTLPALPAPVYSTRLITDSEKKPINIGSAPPRLAKFLAFNADGSLDTSFSTASWATGLHTEYSGPKAREGISSVSPNGELFVTGENLEGSGHRIYKLNAFGEKDPYFSTLSFNGRIHKLLFTSDQKIYAIGSFTSYGGGTPAINVIRLNPDGSRDSAFDSTTGVQYTITGSPYGSQYDGTFSGAILTGLILPDGNLLLSGYFSSYKGTFVPSNLIIVNSSGALVSAPALTPGPGACRGMVYDSYGGILAWSNGSVTSNGGTIINGGNADLTRWIYSGGVLTKDLYWGEFTGNISSVLSLPDGRLIVRSGTYPYSIAYSGKSYPTNSSLTDSYDSLVAPTSIYRIFESKPISGSLQRYFSPGNIIDRSFNENFFDAIQYRNFYIAELNSEGIFQKGIYPQEPDEDNIVPTPSDFLPSLVLGPNDKIYVDLKSGVSEAEAMVLPLRLLVTLTKTVFYGSPAIVGVKEYYDVAFGFPFSLNVSSIPISSNYSATGLPSGLTINSSTGVISGAPTSLGVFVVNLSATNTQGTGTKSFVLHVNSGISTVTSSTKALRKFSSGGWVEFLSLKRGDIVLTPASNSVLFPWGEPGKTYNLSPWGEPDFTVPSVGSAPSGYKYKYYIGAKVSQPVLSFEGS